MATDADTISPTHIPQYTLGFDALIQDKFKMQSFLIAPFVANPSNSISMQAAMKDPRLNLNWEITDMIMQCCRLLNHNDRIYVFNGNHYIYDYDALKRLVVASYLMVNKRYTKEAYETIVDLLLAHVLPLKDSVNANKNYIPFKNGYLYIPTLKLMDPDPDFYYTHGIDYNYNPKAQCPYWLEYLLKAIPDQKNRDRFCIYLAYCFTLDVDLRRALLLIGPGGNGKSVGLSILVHILGESNCVDMPLNLLGERFNKSKYMNKLLIYHDEIDPDALESATQFKALTGTLKQITGEIKGVQEEVTYGLESKMIYAGNRIPTPKFVPDDAFWDRWIIVPFVQRIRGTADDNKKFTEERLYPEIEGIIAYLMPYLSRLNELNTITKEEIRHLWYRWGESPFAFYEESLIDPDHSTDTQELFQQYKKYCQWALLPQCTLKRFGQVMAELGISRIQITGGTHIYDGIKFPPNKYKAIIMELEKQKKENPDPKDPNDPNDSTHIEGIPINMGRFVGFNDIG